MLKIINKTILIFLILLSISCQSKKEGEYCKQVGDTLSCNTFKAGHLIKTEVKHIKYGIRLGGYYEFSLSGDTLIKAMYRNGLRIGSYNEYYVNKKPKLYIYFDYFNEDTMYYRAYDENGKIKDEKGELFHEDYYTAVGNRNLDKNNILEVLSVAIVPPNTIFKVKKCFMFNIDNLNDTIYPFISYYEPNQNNGLYNTSFKMKETGKYRLYILTELEDPDKNKTWKKEEIYEFSFPYIVN